MEQGILTPVEEQQVNSDLSLCVQLVGPLLVAASQENA
jgi:hypothetical protein